MNVCASTVTCGDTEEDAIELLELGGVVQDGDIGRLGGRVHLCEDIIGKGLCDSVVSLDCVCAGSGALWGLCELFARDLARTRTGKERRHHQPP
jgi:hypothetical protein